MDRGTEREREGKAAGACKALLGALCPPVRSAPPRPTPRRLRGAPMATVAAAPPPRAAPAPPPPPRGDDGTCFDCHICYDTAREPVVTLCGHLYCGPCLYR